MTYTLYALFDEREPDAMRYIGFTRHPERRLIEHLQAARASTIRSYRLHWIRKVISDGARVLWRSLAIVETADEAAALEIVAIRAYLATGHPLTNGTEGGEGVQGFGGVMAPEALARRNATLNSPAYIEERGRLSTQYWSTEETRDQHRQAMKAYWASPEGLALKVTHSESAKAQCADPEYRGGPRTPEARAKMSAAKLGKPHARQRTPEWNAKIAAAQKGKPRGPMSQDHRDRHSAALSSEETRAKMSAAAKARWARKREMPK